MTTIPMQFLRFKSLPRPLLSSFFKKGKHNFVALNGAKMMHCSSLVEGPEFECDVLQDDVKAREKDTALHSALSELASDFSKESMLSLKRFFSSRHAQVVSTGSLKLDLALGIGGVPKGRFVEIFGQEASGKTTLALHIIKEAQKHGGYCAYLDVENAMNGSLLESVGVDSENLLIAHPDSGERLLSMVDTLTKSNSVDVIVVDSVAALVPQCEIDEPISGTSKGEQSVMMARALRKISYSLSQSGTVVIFLNQIRANPKSSQGFGRVDEVTCGGNALKFYAAVRMRMARRRLLKTYDKVTGLEVCVQVVKNKLAPAMRNAELEIHFGKGIISESDVFELACEHGVIAEEGNNYLVEGEVFGSKKEAELYLAENSVIYNRINVMLRRRLFMGGRTP